MSLEQRGARGQRSSRRRLEGRCRVFGPAPIVLAQQFDEPADLLPVLGGVAEHRRLPINHIAVATPLPLPFDEAGVDQVGEDPLGGSNGDADGIGHIAQPHIGIAGDAQQHLRVVCHELPAAALA
jgi:hypothetical protein